MSVKKYNILDRVTELGIGPVKMLSDLDNNPELVDAYAKYAFSNQKYAWRAAWIISHYSKKKPELIQKYVNDFILAAKHTEANGHLRETLKIIYNLKLNEEQTSEIFDLCMDLLEDNKRQPSVRMIAFSFLIRVAKNYPELSSEIEIIVENIKEYLSPGIKHSMTQRINKIKKTTK